MKQNVTKKLMMATLLSLAAFTSEVNGQCLTATWGLYPSITYFPLCNGTAATIASDCYAGEYSMVNVTSGIQYTFASSNSTDYLTIGNEGGTSSYTSGTTPVVWTATFSGNVRFYTHSGAACGSSVSLRSRTVQCNTSVVAPSGCATNIAPADAMTNVPINPATTFSWTAVPGAAGYRLYMGESVATAEPVINTTATTVSLFGFEPGATTYWYVVPTNAGGDATGCDANAFSFTTEASVSNDECAGAIAINALSGVQSGDANWATESMPGCSGDAFNDIWYKTTTDNAGNLTITAVSDANTDLVLEVFSGTCSGLTSLQCQDITGYGGVETYTVTGAAANATYYFRLYDFDGFGASYNFMVSGSALPVTMDKLKGQINERGLAQLSWKTLSEHNNKGFQVQRSADGINFSTVGFVGSQAANGNSQEALNYNFIDADAVKGTAYYRLQQTDIDGKTALSNTVRLSAKENGAFEIVAVPNPVKDRLSLKTYGVRGDNAQVLITDLSGKVVRQIYINADETGVDMSSVAHGIYLLKYTDGTRTQTIKVSKQ